MTDDKLRPLQSRHLPVYAAALDERASRGVRMARCQALGRCLDATIRNRARTIGVNGVAAELGLEPLTVKRVLEKRDG